MYKSNAGRQAIQRARLSLGAGLINSESIWVSRRESNEDRLELCDRSIEPKAQGIVAMAGGTNSGHGTADGAIQHPGHRRRINRVTFCPKCKEPMPVIALIEDPAVIRRFLEHGGLWAARPAMT